MKKYMDRYHGGLYAAVLGMLVLGFSACKKEYADPSGPSTGQAFSSVNGLTDVAVGLQNWYTAGRGGMVYNTITASGLVTGELYVVNAGNTDEAQLGNGGGAVQNTNGILKGLWSVANKIIYDADNVIREAGANISDKNYAGGLIAYTSIFKALAIGDMAMFWDHIPDGIADTLGVAHVGFMTGTAGYTEAVSVIDNALAGISANTTYPANIPAGLSIVNTLYALKARFALFAGDYATALSAANMVDTTVRSVFSYNSITTNPIFTLATSTNNIYQPVDSTMGLPAGLAPDLNDKREPVYISIGSNPRFRISGFFTATTQSIPVYLPGEIMLIKAECYARQSQPDAALDELNRVVTKQPADDPFGVGAGLSSLSSMTQDELLTQIYRNRCIELYMSGLKLEDMRRFGRPTAERKRNYFPYPFVERNDNPNTPDDPTF